MADEIEGAGYELLEPIPEMGSRITHILNLASRATIPVDPANPDFQEFLIWNGKQVPPLPWHLPWNRPKNGGAE